MQVTSTRIENGAITYNHLATDAKTSILANVGITFRADGFLRVINNLDPTTFTFATNTLKNIYIYREVAGTAGSTAIRLTKNGASLYTTTIAYTETTKGINSLSLSVTNGDLLALDITAIESGEPQTLVVTATV
jgi:hypothetical protein